MVRLVHRSGQRHPSAPVVREVWEAQRLPCLSALMVRVLPLHLVGLLVRVLPAHQSVLVHLTVPVARPHQNVPMILVLPRLLRVDHLNDLLKEVILLFQRVSSHRAKLLPCQNWVVVQVQQVARQTGQRR